MILLWLAKEETVIDIELLMAVSDFKWTKN